MPKEFDSILEIEEQNNGQPEINEKSQHKHELGSISEIEFEDLSVAVEKNQGETTDRRIVKQSTLPAQKSKR